MIRILLILLVMVLIYTFVKRLLTGQGPAIAVTGRGVGLRGMRAAAFVEWNEIRQIDVVRMPNVGAEHFCVILFGNNALTLYDHYRGFGLFAETMFARWPALRAEWTRVAAGPRDISERVTVWKRDKA